MVPETPLGVILFGQGFNSAQPQINSSQLNSIAFGSACIRFAVGAWGAEWRWVDLEVGREVEWQRKRRTIQARKRRGGGARLLSRARAGGGHAVNAASLTKPWWQ